MVSDFLKFHFFFSSLKNLKVFEHHFTFLPIPFCWATNLNLTTMVEIREFFPLLTNQNRAFTTVWLLKRVNPFCSWSIGLFGLFLNFRYMVSVSDGSCQKQWLVFCRASVNLCLEYNLSLVIYFITCFNNWMTSKQEQFESQFLTEHQETWHTGAIINFCVDGFSKINEFNINFLRKVWHHL